MFLALDKVMKQGLDKVIVDVLEMSIGGSFKDTDLTSYGFFARIEVCERVRTTYFELRIKQSERKTEHYFLPPLPLLLLLSMGFH